MRILHWTDGYWPMIGGAQCLLEDLAQRQRAGGHDVKVVADPLHGRLPADEVHDGVAIRRWPIHRILARNDVGGLRRVADEVLALKRSFRPAVVHIHLNGMSSWCFFLTQSVDYVPTVLTLHPPWSLAKDTIPRLIFRRLLDSSDRIVGVSAQQLESFREAWPDIRPKSEVVLNGLPLPEEAPGPLVLEPPTLLCLGRLEREKGFDVAIQAYRLIRERVPGARLIIAGDGDERAGLERLGVEAGVPGIEFTGWVEPRRVPALINRAGVVLMPSRWPEPFGLVAVQAAQMARPIVASDVGGLPEVVRDGETGRLVPPEDPAALAAAVLSLLSDPAGARRMGEAARDRARREFTMDRCAAEYERIYRGLAP